jgi:hypothetical protein
MLKSSSLCLYSLNLGTFWLKIEQFWPLQIRKKGDEIKICSSPLKLLSQSQPNFAEMILGWSSWIQDGADGHNFERGPPKDHFSKAWLRLAQ